MGLDLDLNDVAATSPKAKAELEALRAENARLRANANITNNERTNK